MLEFKKTQKELPNNSEISWSQQMLIRSEDSVFLRTRKIVFGTLNDVTYNAVAKYLSYLMSIIIVGSILQFSLETVYELNNTDGKKAIFDGFDLFFNITFSIDYFSKIMFCPNYFMLPKFIVSPSWIVDLLSILPFYIELILASSSGATVLRIVRIIRIFRILRLLKASKNMKQVHMMFNALRSSLEAVIMLGLILFNSLILFGAFVFFAELGISDYDENGTVVYSQNSITSGFQSIPHTMWYVIVTMTTVLNIYQGWIW
eukprot:NODE_654_length_5502_cov_0.204516.p1 type:complete len:260 gc:universal NODE_654_length_5502_cov_0.204516:3898-3119(-)